MQELKQLPITELLRIYKVQIKTDNIDCINDIKLLIKNKVFDDFTILYEGTNGCCSEYRNSFNFFSKDIFNAIKDILTEEEKGQLEDYIIHEIATM